MVYRTGFDQNRKPLISPQELYWPLGALLLENGLQNRNAQSLSVAETTLPCLLTAADDVESAQAEPCLQEFICADSLEEMYDAAQFDILTENKSGKSPSASADEQNETFKSFKKFANESEDFLF